MKTTQFLRPFVGLLLTLLVSASADAQVKRPAQTQQRPSKVAIYGEIKAQNVYMTNDTIYYVEKGENNAVIAIDRKTGGKTTIVPGIAGIYEGARPRIKKFASLGGHFIFTLEGRENVYLYTGPNIKEALHFEQATDMMTFAGDLALFSSSTRTKDGRICYDLWNIRSLKQLWSYDYESVNRGDVSIAADGSVWYYARHSYGVRGNSEIVGYGMKRLTPDGKVILYAIDDLPYVKENNIKGKTDEEYAKAVQKGDWIYLPVHRRVYRINTQAADPQWEEYAKMPATMNERFGKLIITPSGDFISRMGSSTLLFRAGKFEQPESLGGEIQTGVTSPYGYREIYVNQCSARTDDENNYVFLYRGNNELYIYNPDGVKGYTKARGTVIK